jgi:hypothetical protein
MTFYDKLTTTLFNKLKITAFALALAGFGFGPVGEVSAQRRVNDAQVGRIIAGIERRSDTFRRSFDAALDRSPLDGSYTEELVNQYIKDFEEATSNMRARFDNRLAVAADVDNLLNRAAQIDRFLRTNLRQRQVQSDWTLLRSDLGRLANAYNVALNLDGRFDNIPAIASRRAYRVSDAQVETLLASIEWRTDNFRTSLSRALDRSRFDDTNRENNVNEFVTDFENATDELRRKFDGRTSVGDDVAGILVRAARVDDFMKRNLRRELAAQRTWRNLRADLNRLANFYALAFNLDDRRNMPASAPGGVLTNADARFTGTYRLNTYLSDNARTVAGRAVTQLNRNSRDRVFNHLVRRLEAPEMLAVERQGLRVMLASSASPRVTFDADGRLRAERYPNGRASNVRASFLGDALTVVSNGDRANDFTAVFTALEEGRRMLVTRRVFAEGLSRYVEVKSYYDRTDETARFNLVNRNSNVSVNPGDNFIVPDATRLVAVLNTDLSTRTTRDGDRFSMTVRRPALYAGAIIEGRVLNPNRSDRITGRSEMTLNYETIRFNNRTYRFAGMTQSVRPVSGQGVRIDNEGAIKDRDSQTKQTIGRTAIGAGVGAILGAILGGEGAGIGAGIGAGAGAASVYIQGRDDLNLTSGAEFTISASAPPTLVR